MAIYHFDVAAVSRREGGSAVKSWAYISGTRQVDERTGRVHNYSRKARSVLAKGSFGPVDWQECERAEKRWDSKVARTIIVALPSELDLAAQVSLLCKLARGLREQHGVACGWAVHEAPGDPRNRHGHLLLTTRRVDDAGGEAFILALRVDLFAVASLNGTAVTVGVQFRALEAGEFALAVAGQFGQAHVAGTTGQPRAGKAKLVLLLVTERTPQLARFLFGDPFAKLQGRRFVLLTVEIRVRLQPNGGLRGRLEVAPSSFHVAAHPTGSAAAILFRRVCAR